MNFHVEEENQIRRAKNNLHEPSHRSIYLCIDQATPAARPTIPRELNQSKQAHHNTRQQ